MRITDIAIGAPVKVRRGYGVRPAVVTSIHNGKVHVRFTDITHEEARKIPRYNRQDLFGAVVYPNQVKRGNA